MTKKIGLSKKPPVNEASYARTAAREAAQKAEQKAKAKKVPVKPGKEAKPLKAVKPVDTKPAAKPVAKPVQTVVHDPVLRTKSGTPKRTRTPKGVTTPRPVAVAKPAPDGTTGPAGTYADYPILATTLPPLLAQQRELVAQITPDPALVEQEKAVREEMEALIMASGVPEDDEHVTCGDFDVRRVEVKGRKTIIVAILRTQLVQTGVLDIDQINEIIDASTKEGKPSSHVRVGYTKEAKQALGLKDDDEEGDATDHAYAETA